MEDLILGIDAGGSKTVAWLAALTAGGQPRILGRGTAGAANAQASGFPAALENLSVAVAAAFAAAGMTRRPVAAAVLAAAGSDREENRRAFSAWADQLALSARFQVVHDAWPLLAAGTPQGWGIALISGTGSLAFGRTANGRTARAGGWGYLFGDEGSGYAMGLAGLRAAAQAADGRAAPTRLLAAVLRHFAVDRPEVLIAAVYSAAGDRPRIAALCETVLQLAAEGDTAARAIADSAARDLAAMVAAVARRLTMPDEPIPLALGGGALTGSPLLQELLAQQLARVGLAAGPVTAVSEPVSGAVKLAQAAV